MDPRNSPSDSESRCETKILPPRLATGQRLRHFELESVLGEGGMGVVYRAQDTQLCRPVAVKVLPPQLTADPDRKQRFLQEARAAARISHPSVAQIYYVDEQDDTTFLVMELVEGKTVREMIQGGDLDLLGVIDVVTQAADGLAKAHELGIVHRDIKPANVMVTPEGHVKILDFGLAKLLDRGPSVPSGALPEAALAQTTMPGVVMGTAAYMSPEQVRGVGVDGRADIFSLGVLLFEMATGRSPFQRESFMDSLHAVAFEEPPPLAAQHGHLPYGLQQIVSRCLRKRPEERYPDARLLARDLREFRRNSDASLPPRTHWRVRVMEAWDRLRQLRPTQYVWFGIGGAAAGYALYVSFSRIGPGGVVFLALAGLYIWRHIRSRPRKAQELFVRKVARIPEVRLITFRNQQFTVVIDRPVAQLYNRINQQLQMANRKLYFGEPMTVSIIHGVEADAMKRLLSNSGVQHVREDVVKEV